LHANADAELIEIGALLSGADHEIGNLDRGF
jgi:hypothetical protein